METLKKFIKYALIFGGVLFYLVAGYGIVRGDGDTMIRYDCNIAEFQPDYPQQVKEACRNLRHATSI